ncbi:Negative regulator of genetic competence ClpC/MecB [bioreactor metagenome]|uniref:Negative regulator of genetic competence ClpC/MecB n=2 Tax=root TaxID=1 RepID=A0A645DPF9_9ZZZZ
MERHEVGKLIGAPPGYVGYDEGGKLTEAIRRRPYSVVLFDEIEKAHEDIFNTLLQILEDGRLTDGQGHTVDFRNAVIIMTSNVGAKELAKGTSLGFSVTEETDGYFDWSKTKSYILDAVQKTFRPEFINRIDEMVVFRPLNKKEMLSIVDIMLNEIKKRLLVHDIDINVSEEAKGFILEKGYNPKFGARPLRRKIQQLIEDRLADLLLEGKVKRGSQVFIGLSNGEITVKSRKTPKKQKKEKKAAV